MVPEAVNEVENVRLSAPMLRARDDIHQTLAFARCLMNSHSDCFVAAGARSVRVSRFIARTTSLMESESMLYCRRQ